MNHNLLQEGWDLILEIGGELNMKKTDQISRTWFLGKSFGISLYDIGMKRRYTIDHE